MSDTEHLVIHLNCLISFSSNCLFLCQFFFGLLAFFLQVLPFVTDIINSLSNSCLSFNGSYCGVWLKDYDYMIPFCDSLGKAALTGIGNHSLILWDWVCEEAWLQRNSTRNLGVERTILYPDFGDGCMTLYIFKNHGIVSNFIACQVITLEIYRQI